MSCPCRIELHASFPMIWDSVRIALSKVTRLSRCQSGLCSANGEKACKSMLDEDCAVIRCDC